MYYGAYGANLNKANMEVRCPQAKPMIGFMLEGYKLVFNGVADIVKDKSASVPIGLWKITKRWMWNPDEGGMPEIPPDTAFTNTSIMAAMAGRTFRDESGPADKDFTLVEIFKRLAIPVARVDVVNMVGTMELAMFGDFDWLYSVALTRRIPRQRLLCNSPSSGVLKKLLCTYVP